MGGSGEGPDTYGAEGSRLRPALSPLAGAAEPPAASAAHGRVLAGCSAPAAAPPFAPVLGGSCTPGAPPEGRAFASPGASLRSECGRAPSTKRPGGFLARDAGVRVWVRAHVSPGPRRHVSKRYSLAAGREPLLPPPPGASLLPPRPPGKALPSLQGDAPPAASRGWSGASRAGKRGAALPSP